MSFRFERLTVWQDARKFTTQIYTATKHFPAREAFGLTAQVRRAAMSVTLNVAEGSDRKSDIEFRRFLRVSLGSLNEVVTALYIARDEGYLDEREFVMLYKQANELASKIHALISRL